jgi:hypothetical protein
VRPGTTTRMAWRRSSSLRSSARSLPFDPEPSRRARRATAALTEGTHSLRYRRTLVLVQHELNFGHYYHFILQMIPRFVALAHVRFHVSFHPAEG